MFHSHKKPLIQIPAQLFPLWTDDTATEVVGDLVIGKFKSGAVICLDGTDRSATVHRAGDLYFIPSPGKNFSLKVSNNNNKYMFIM